MAALAQSAPAPLIRRILRIDAVAEVLGCHRNSVYRYVREEKLFPQPIRIGKHSIGFYEDELAAYVAQLPRSADKPTFNTGKIIKRKGMTHKRKKAA